MDAILNPFAPGAGSPPPELAGRAEILEQVRVLLGRIKNKKPEKSLFLTGLRGVGKTVPLNAIDRMAVANGYMTILVEASEDKSLPALLVPRIRKLLFDLDRLAGAGNKVRKALAALKGLVGAIKLSMCEIELGLDLDPDTGLGESGDLNSTCRTSIRSGRCGTPDPSGACRRIEIPC